MKNNTAIFPGSFDPITIGHVDIVNRSIKLFNNIIIVLSINAEKQYMFSEDERITMIKKVFKKNNKITVVKHDGLTVDFCVQNNIANIIRGIRTYKDFEYEQNLSFANKALEPSVETFFLSSKKEHVFISSSIVKDVITNNGKMEPFLPKEIIPYVYSQLTK